MITTLANSAGENMGKYGDKSVRKSQLSKRMVRTEC